MRVTVLEERFVTGPALTTWVVTVMVPLKWEILLRVIVTVAELPGCILSWDWARVMAKPGGKGSTTVIAMEWIIPLQEAETITE